MASAQLVETAEGLAVRFVRDYSAPAERVWAAVAETTGLASWFPAPKVAFEPRVGARMSFSGDPGDPDAVFTGRVIALEPGSTLRFEWGEQQLWFDVLPVGDGARFTLTEVLAHENQAARDAAGWDVCLAALDAALGDETTGNGARAWGTEYQAYIDRGFPHGAPVPSV